MATPLAPSRLRDDSGEERNQYYGVLPRTRGCTLSSRRLGDLAETQSPGVDSADHPTLGGLETVPLPAESWKLERKIQRRRRNNLPVLFHPGRHTALVQSENPACRPPLRGILACGRRGKPGQGGQRKARINPWGEDGMRRDGFQH